MTSEGERLRASELQRIRELLERVIEIEERHERDRAQEEEDARVQARVDAALLARGITDAGPSLGPPQATEEVPALVIPPSTMSAPSASGEIARMTAQWLQGAHPLWYVAAVLVLCLALFSDSDGRAWVLELWSGRDEIAEAVAPRPRFHDRQEFEP